MNFDLPSDALVVKYYLYKITTAAGFTVPVWTLFLLNRGISYTELFVLDAAWMGATVLGETPTGYIGDRIGRRNSLLVSIVVITGSLVAFAFAQSFPAFVVIYVVWAIGETFRSGSDSAWLYDSLTERMDEDEFAAIQGRGRSLSLVTLGVTSVVWVG